MTPSTREPAGPVTDAERGDDGWRSSILLPALLRAAVPILLITLLAGYLAYTRSADRPAVYEATSRVVLSSAENFSPVDTAFSGGGGADRYVGNQSEVMTTIAVLDIAAEALEDGVTGSELRDQVSAEPVSDNNAIDVTVSASDAELAARRADAIAEAYARFTRAQVRSLADDAAEAAAADPVLVRSIRARAAVFDDGVSVIQPAAVPSAPVSPTPKRNAYLAAAVAFLLSAGLAITLRRTRRPAGPKGLASEAGAPLLGEVHVRWLGGTAAGQQPHAASYALALHAVRYALPDGADPSVLLTDIGRDRSAASAALGLATADAANGRRVVLVDATADGRLLGRAGVPSPPLSLTTAVAAGKDLDGGLRSVPSLAGRQGGSVRIARLEPDSVVPSDLLRTSLRALLDEADLVLLYAGSVERDASAFALLGEVGAVVAVVPARGRRSKGLSELRQRLALAHRKCDGVLVAHRVWLPSVTSRPAETHPAAPPTVPARRSTDPDRQSGEAPRSPLEAGRTS